MILEHKEDFVSAIKEVKDFGKFTEEEIAEIEKVNDTSELKGKLVYRTEKAHKKFKGEIAKRANIAKRNAQSPISRLDALTMFAKRSDLTLLSKYIKVVERVLVDKKKLFTIGEFDIASRELQALSLPCICEQCKKWSGKEEDLMAKTPMECGADDIDTVEGTFFADEVAEKNKDFIDANISNKIIGCKAFEPKEEIETDNNSTEEK